MRKRLFEKLYAKQAAFANGRIQLGEEDYAKIREIYDNGDFTEHFGAPYNDKLVVPAMRLCKEMRLDADVVTRAWEQGRQRDIWHNNQWDGLNKIGYQRSVFPVVLKMKGREQVRILLNGYIPGLRRLFTEGSARLIAIHVTTSEDWPIIRNRVAGGESDPQACENGSIRYDAFRGIIPLEPRYKDETDEPVNGQRNVCHASATGLDSFRELIELV